MIKIENNKLNLDNKTLKIITDLYKEANNYDDLYTRGFINTSAETSHLDHLVKCFCGRNNFCNYNLYIEGLNFSGTRKKINHELNWNCANCNGSQVSIHFNNNSLIDFASSTHLNKDLQIEWQFTENKIVATLYNGLFESKEMVFQIKDFDLNLLIIDSPAFKKRINKLLILA